MKLCFVVCIGDQGRWFDWTYVERTTLLCMHSGTFASWIYTLQSHRVCATQGRVFRNKWRTMSYSGTANVCLTLSILYHFFIVSNMSSCHCGTSNFGTVEGTAWTIEGAASMAESAIGAIEGAAGTVEGAAGTVVCVIEYWALTECGDFLMNCYLGMSKTECGYSLSELCYLSVS